MWAGEALTRFIEDYPSVRRVLDIGSGDGEHAKVMRQAGMIVDCIDWRNGDDYNAITFLEPYDGIWCSHVLEHQLNVNSFLKKVRRDLKPMGVFAVTVPPAKHEIVGGHVTLWNQGLLLYNLILAGFNCSEARVSPLYDSYNLSVIVRNVSFPAVTLKYDAGDIEALVGYFPIDVRPGFDGSAVAVGWECKDA